MSIQVYLLMQLYFLFCSPDGSVDHKSQNIMHTLKEVSERSNTLEKKYTLFVYLWLERRYLSLNLIDFLKDALTVEVFILGLTDQESKRYQ